MWENTPPEVVGRLDDVIQVQESQSIPPLPRNPYPAVPIADRLPVTTIYDITPDKTQGQMLDDPNDTRFLFSISCDGIIYGPQAYD